MDDLQDANVAAQKGPTTSQSISYTSQQQLNNERKQMINNFFQETKNDNRESRDDEVLQGAAQSEQNVNKKPNKEQKLIEQIIQNYHNLDAQAQNYILKLFIQKTKDDQSQEVGQLLNYFDVSLNQSGSATTYRQSELVQEQPFDSNKDQNRAVKEEMVAKEKDSPLKKRVQAKQVDFMNKGHKLTNQMAIRKHRSR